jgi:hypothetical protein
LGLADIYSNPLTASALASPLALVTLAPLVGEANGRS